MSLLLAGLPKEVPGSTINRLCGSGMDAVIAAARAIKAGEAELMIAGGVESMSRAPFVMPKAAEAFSRNAEIYDTTIGWRFVNPRMKTALWHRLHAGNGRERRAKNLGSAEPTRTLLPCAARSAGPWRPTDGLAREIVSCERSRSARAQPIVVEHDEHPRADTTLEQLAKLAGHLRARLAR